MSVHHKTNRNSGLLAVACVLALIACSQPETDAGVWPGWRGAVGTGVSADQGLPLKWNADGLGLRWKAKIENEGISSPIVSKSAIFLTGEEKQGLETALKVMSLDLDSGELLWETTVFHRMREEYPPRSVVNSPAGPTPVTDGEQVYAYFGSHLAAIDFEGKVVWLEEIDPVYLEQSYYGAASSLVLAGSNVIVFRDRETVKEGLLGWIAAFDRRTGKQQWKDEWQDTCCSYTTPVLHEGESGTEILVAQAGRLVSFDPDSGEKLWRRKQQVNQPVASPVIEGEFVCVASGAHSVRDTTCWRLRTRREETKPKALWSSKKGAPEMASPVLTGGFLYTVTQRGVMTCRNVETGKQAWVKRLPQGHYTASLVAGDGKIYVIAKDGRTSVVAASPRFKLLAENKLPGSGVVASPAIAAGCLLVRTSTHLLCIEGERTET